MFKGYGQPYGANMVFAGAATNTPGRIGIWVPIERAKQLAISSLKFSVLMHRNVGEETCLDPDGVRKPPRKRLLGETTFHISAGAFKLGKEHRDQ